MATATKLLTRLSQRHLLTSTVNNPKLLDSRILSSINPNVGKVFKYQDLEDKKQKILRDARRKLINLCAIPEADRDITTLRIGVNPSSIHNTELEKNLRVKREHKINFHLRNPPKRTAGKVSRRSERQRKRRRTSRTQKTRKRRLYRARKAERKRQELDNKIQEIRSSLVRNLSSLEIPDEAFLYLAKGLNFVEVRNFNKFDLKFDASEYLRKLEWKAFFHDTRGDEDTVETVDLHPNLRIPSRNSPRDYQNTIVEDIKGRLLSYIDTLDPPKPKSNLTRGEIKGKKWILERIGKEEIFVTRADKGGATLILNYQDALSAIRSAVDNRENFCPSSQSIEDRMTETTKKVQTAVLGELEERRITEEDKLRITGLNKNNNLKQSPLFRPVIPYTYPLFKLHKLSEEQIKAKTTPPARLVHATRAGPLYRLEKWVSPYITEISRRYCGSEFILDTDDLLQQVTSLCNANEAIFTGGGTRLFTLDVVSLYPSIRPEVALRALEHAFTVCCTASDLRNTLRKFITLILEQSFITFEGKVYTSIKGIPTGNCISRQLADITLHWLLFYGIENGIPTQVRLWRRFIDDILGVWVGSERQLESFIKHLNTKTEGFGIQFGDQQYGDRVNFLDVSLYIEDRGLQYELYRKPTDARLYLKTDSYHHESVFKSVAVSQLIRVMKRNSLPETRDRDVEDLKSDLEKSGHKREVLNILQPRALERVLTQENPEEGGSSPQNASKLMFITSFFKGIDKLKTFVRSLDEDIRTAAGNVHTVFALRKHPSIGNTVVRNRRLSEGSEGNDEGSVREDQRCGGRGCKTCDLMGASTSFTTNQQTVKLDMSLNCKSSNIIYIAQCRVCLERGERETTYIGQTMTPLHVRFNGHRNKFKIDRALTYEKSALSLHCFLKHKDNFDLGVFNVGVIRKVPAVELDRFESRFIEQLKTKVFGLNRMVVVR